MSEYKPQTLAGTLLLHLGTLPIEEIRRMEAEERGEFADQIETIEQITTAIARVTQRMMSGKLTPPEGRAQLYGLQTLLVAKRMEEERTAGRVIEIPMLQAGAGPDEVLQRIIDLARATSEDREE